MNIRKPIDYSIMFAALDALMSAELPQMELYCEIGRLISERPEKGAAVAAAEYLQNRYPEASGFSPRNVRRMRDLYKLYEGNPQLMEQALHLNWTQNVVIMEADLSMEERMWYLQSCAEHGWSKSELQSQIDNAVHLEVPLDQSSVVWYNNASEQEARTSQNDKSAFYLPRQYMQESDGGICNEGYGEEGRTGEELPDCLRSYQYRGDRSFRLPSSPAQAGRAWDSVRWTHSTAARKPRLRQVRPPDWDGSGESPQYAPHLRWGLRRQDAPPVGLYRLPRRCCRPLVYGRLRGDLAGCAGGLPRAA